MILPVEPGAMVFHPGEFLADEMIARKLTPKDLVCRGWKEERVLLLLQGKRRINHALAKHIRGLTNIDIEFWFRLQVQWDAYPKKRQDPPWPRQFSQKGTR